MRKKGMSSPTAAFCPSCRRATIGRVGGEWCRWCRDFVRDAAIVYSPESKSYGTVRVLGRRVV